MIEELKKELKSLAEPKYREFSSKLTPNINNILGVRLPSLRKLAKRIAKENYIDFFKQNDGEFMELTMLEGMVIGYLPTQVQQKYIKNFIPKINNWAVCDSFCTGLKGLFNSSGLPRAKALAMTNDNTNTCNSSLRVLAKQSSINTKTNLQTNKILKQVRNDNSRPPELILESFLKPYLNSNREYELRFAFVILLNYFIDDDYNYVIKKISEFNNEQYYAKMAVAWCLSICIVKNYNQAVNDICEFQIRPWVLKKGITKAIESLRLTPKQKEELKNIRKTICQI